MKILFTAGLFLTCMQLFAQGLHGYVYGEQDGGSKESLIGAVIVWQGTRNGTVTDDNGFYSIGRPPGATHLIVSYTGFRSDTVQYNGQSELNFILKPDATLKVVNVTEEVGATQISMLNPQNFQVLNEKELCKAACCNLSESFETNASIDAAFADAITGTRQIRMLGLDGKYTQMMFDNMPAVRGLASTYGLTYVPGPWIKNIYIAKGVGSVIGGYESITGQINVAIKNPDNAERFHLNAYAGTGGRLELNAVYKPGANDDHHESSRVRLHPIFLGHVAMSQLRTDMNGDGFLDNPLFSNIILRNEWHLETPFGLGSQITLGYIHLKNVSGQLDYNPIDEIKSKLWGVDLTTDRYEATAKTGYVFKEKEWKSFGLQSSVSWHNQSGHYGFRSYSGQQLSARANLIFATRIVNERNKITSGISYQYDDYLESITFKEFPPIVLNSQQLNRREMVPGVFAEYTVTHGENLSAVMGARADYHNYYGLFFTPRLHARYSFSKNTSLKLVAGKGYRTANLLMDNVGILAGNRDIRISGDNADGIFGLDMEEAWNLGLILSKKFKVAHRDASLSIDGYHTSFVNQVVLDLETPGIASFYNLNGKSFSHSIQAELHWTPFRRLEWRMAYRWLEAMTVYSGELKERPLVNKHRAFTNLAYATKEKSNGAHWRFDATIQWISRKRIPFSGHSGNHDHEMMETTSTYSDSYIQLNSQVTYVFKKNVELYVGGENLTNFMVHDAIILSDQPNSELFDGSLLWGPVFGRMGYIGFRWIIE